MGVQKRFGSYQQARLATVGGAPGLLVCSESAVTQVTVFEIFHNKISALYEVRNPEKLRHIGLELRRS